MFSFLHFPFTLLARALLKLPYELVSAGSDGLQPCQRYLNPISCLIGYLLYINIQIILCDLSNIKLMSYVIICLEKVKFDISFLANLKAYQKAKSISPTMNRIINSIWYFKRSI